MDLSNHAAVLKEIKRRFPLGCTVEDKDRDRATILDYKYVEIEQEDAKIWYMGKDFNVYLFIYDTWSKVITPAQSTLSPLQETFSKFINL